MKALWIFPLLCILAAQCQEIGARPQAVAAAWAGLVGRYEGTDSRILVLERGGRLYFSSNAFGTRVLTHAGPDSFLAIGPRARSVEFRRNERGFAAVCEVDGAACPRIPSARENERPFRIEPLAPVEKLRQAAFAAQPPKESGRFAEPEFVELISLELGLKLDIRYASERNFMGSAMYESPRAFLRRPAALAVARAHRAAKEWGFGLIVYDAYRPWYVTKLFWDATPAEYKDYVADPRKGSRHNRGAAVDVGLYDLRTGIPVEMPSDYDEFDETAHVDYAGGTSLERWHRDLLIDSMCREGFSVYSGEWWHFDFRDWRRYPLCNLSFEELAQEGAQGEGAE